MDFETVKAWLDAHNNRQIRHRWLLAWLGLVLLPIATVVGGLLTYGLLRVATNDSRDPDIGRNCAWIALGVMVVLFVVNFLIPRKKEALKYYHEDPDDSAVATYMRRRKVVPQLMLWIILTGPRLLTWSVFSFKEISRLKKQDTHSCAALLWLLMVKRSKVPYDVIPKELDWLDLEMTLAQLEGFPGLLFLKNPPPGISLSDDTRTAIRTGAPLP